MIETPLLVRLRRHYDQDYCNEEPQDVIDTYEKDRRLAALEIEALYARLEALGASPAPAPTGPNVVRMRGQ